MDDKKQDRFDVDEGARKLAVDTVIRALIEHASATDPDLRHRILATVETYISGLKPHSELEDAFAERARANVQSLIRPASS